MRVKIHNTSKHPMPDYKTIGSAGIDLHANLAEDLKIEPFERKVIPTGLFMEIEEGYEGQVRARSGLALKHGLSLVNGIGTIDSDYRGEIQVILINLGKEDVMIHDGDRIAQMVFAKYEKADLIEMQKSDFTETNRGTQGFGHTGV